MKLTRIQEIFTTIIPQMKRSSTTFEEKKAYVTILRENVGCLQAYIKKYEGHSSRPEAVMQEVDTISLNLLDRETYNTIFDGI